MADDVVSEDVNYTTNLNVVASTQSLFSEAEASTSWNYLLKNPFFAIPELFFLVFVMVVGTVGNVFVIGAVVASKVSSEFRHW